MKKILVMITTCALLLTSCESTTKGKSVQKSVSGSSSSETKKPSKKTKKVSLADVMTFSVAEDATAYAEKEGDFTISDEWGYLIVTLLEKDDFSIEPNDMDAIADDTERILAINENNSDFKKSKPENKKVGKYKLDSIKYSYVTKLENDSESENVYGYVGTIEYEKGKYVYFSGYLKEEYGYDEVDKIIKSIKWN